MVPGPRGRLPAVAAGPGAGESGSIGGAAPAVVRRAHEIYVFQRFDHHLDAARFFSDGFFYPFAVLCAAFFLLGLDVGRRPGLRRLRGFTIAALGLALAGFGLRLLACWQRDLAASLLRFYWFRLADVAVPLSVALLGCRWLVRRSHAIRPGGGDAAGRAPRGRLHGDAAVFRSAVCRSLRRRRGVACRPGDWCRGRAEHPIFPRQARTDRMYDYRSWQATVRLGGRLGRHPGRRPVHHSATAHTFKWYSGRGDVAAWKETPQDAAGLVAWWERIQDIYATGRKPPQDRYYTSLADLGEERLRQLGASTRPTTSLPS